MRESNLQDYFLLLSTQTQWPTTTKISTFWSLAPNQPCTWAQKMAKLWLFVKCLVMIVTILNICAMLVYCAWKYQHLKVYCWMLVTATCLRMIHTIPTKPTTKDWNRTEKISELTVNFLINSFNCLNKKTDQWDTVNCHSLVMMDLSVEACRHLIFSFD